MTKEGVQNPMLQILMLLETPEDKVEFQEIYEYTYRKLIYEGLGILHSQIDAEEIVHDCFVKIAQDYPKYRGKSKDDMLGILHVMVRNAGINRIRQRERHKETLIEVDETLLGADNDPLEEILTEETAGILERAMREMPDEDRDIFTLRYYYDMTYKDIGEKLGMKAKTVDMRLYRAKRKLRELIERDMKNPS